MGIVEHAERKAVPIIKAKRTCAWCAKVLVAWMNVFFMVTLIVFIEIAFPWLSVC